MLGRSFSPQHEFTVFVSEALQPCFSHDVTLLLKSLPWLPVAYRIKVKLDDLP